MFKSSKLGDIPNAAHTGSVVFFCGQTSCQEYLAGLSVELSLCSAFPLGIADGTVSVGRCSACLFCSESLAAQARALASDQNSQLAVCQAPLRQKDWTLRVQRFVDSPSWITNQARPVASRSGGVRLFTRFRLMYIDCQFFHVFWKLYLKLSEPYWFVASWVAWFHSHQD